jgi:hypothetical protein
VKLQAEDVDVDVDVDVDDHAYDNVDVHVHGSELNLPGGGLASSRIPPRMLM